MQAGGGAEGAAADPEGGASEQRRALGVPVESAWQALTCAAGARRWLDDPAHPGIRVGAAIPLWRSPSGTVVAVEDTSAFRIEFPDGRTASITFEPTSVQGCELVVRYAAHPDSGRDAADCWHRLLNAAGFVVAETKANRKSRQAVVVVHGIGSQQPLSTVKGFTDALTHGSKRFSKPDQFSRSYELRRYQIPRDPRRPRTDVFELYWADQVPGTTVTQTTAWVRRLLLRRPKDVGKRLRPVAYAVRATAVLLALATVALALAVGLDGVTRLWSDATALAKVGWVSLGLSLVGGAVTGFLVNSLGDAARYLEGLPDNIAVRQAIREGGVSLLRRLHDEGSYDRIVVVGHSLGSVIAYDVLKYFWYETYQHHRQVARVNQPALKAFEQLVKHAGESAFDLEGIRRAQQEVWRENRRLGSPWLVTDLITVGSPLTHGETLLARSPGHLEQLEAELELPTCPPRLDGKAVTRPQRYLVDGELRNIRLLTHASMFAVVRWTNLYVPARAIVFGDPVGGPVAPVFGSGVKDVEVTTSPWWRRHTPLAHASYWRRTSDGSPSPVPELVAAVGLDSAGWLDALIDELPWSWSVPAAEPTGSTAVDPT